MERKSLREKHKCTVHFGIGRGILVSFEKKKKTNGSNTGFKS